MHNSQKPDISNLPSTARLIRSTVLALVAAILILVTVVLPAEYGIDPTRMGSVLGLTEMGEIKQQLHEEATQDKHSALNLPIEQVNVAQSLLSKVGAFFIGSAHAQSEPTDARTEQITFTLERGEGIEIKLAMEEGSVVQFNWQVAGGKINFDMHGDAKGEEVSYEKGRGVSGQQGDLIAAFQGKHGWFWRNRDKQAVTVTLTVAGDFTEVITYD